MLALPGLTLTNNVPDKVSFKEAVAVTCNCQGLAHHPHNTDKTDGLTLVATLPFSGVPTTGALGSLLPFHGLPQDLGSDVSSLIMDSCIHCCAKETDHSL